MVADRPAANVTARTPTGPLLGFDLFEQLGRGATTVVHRARRAGTGGPDVAVKMLRERTADAAERAALYRREAALVARVSHPSVAVVHAAGEAGGRPYLVLELVAGSTLAALLEDGPLPHASVLRIAAETAGALSAVHRMRLVHRDIKPGNLMITPSEQVKLIDFDLATWVGEPADDGVVTGTMVYSAPEQTSMLARPVDGRADLYALGVAIFECVTGRPPFTAADPGELLRLHAAEPAPDVREMRPDCPPGLAAVIGRLLAKDPDDRYQTASVLAGDLQRLLVEPATWPFPLDSTGAGAGAAPTDAQPPLVGRRPELARLTQMWERTARGIGGPTLITAPAGTGKSRLVDALLDTVERGGGSVLRTRCAADGAVPLSVPRAVMQQHLEAIQRLPGPQQDAATQRLRRAAAGAEALLADMSPALATVLGTGDLTIDERESEGDVASAIAGCLAELARLEGGLLLVVEDVHRIDPASQHVLRHLRAECETAPLLVVLTSTEDRPAELEQHLGLAADAQMRLGPLDPQAVVELVSSELDGATVPDEITGQIAARTGGNPLLLVEYLRQLIEAGGLQPSWGTWILDTALLDRLPVPSDVLDLMIARLEGVGVPTRRILAVAAVRGTRFGATVLRRVTSRAAQDIDDGIAIATRHRLIEHVAADTYTFVHEQIRDALLGDVDDKTRARLHARTAEALESGMIGGDEDAEVVYEIARHRMAADAESAPRSTYDACVAAGRLALAGHGPAEAVGFLGGAARAAAAGGIEPDVGVRMAYATALLRCGDFAAALDAATDALQLERDPLRRAELFRLLATIEHSADDSDLAVLTVQRGLAELGAALPRRLPLLIASTLGRFVMGLLVGVSRRRLGAAAGTRRRRATIEASLLQMGAQAAGLAADQRMLVSFLLRALLPANRIGLSQERTRILAGLGYLAGAVGASRLARRVCAAAERDAALLGDPAAVAFTTWISAIIRQFVDRRTFPVAEVLEAQGPWMDLPFYLTSVTSLVPHLIAVGHTSAAETLLQRARRRLHATADPRDALLVECMAGVVETVRGRAAAGAATMQAALDRLPGDVSPQQRVLVLWARLTMLVEQGEVGDAFDDVVAEIDDAGLVRGNSHAAAMRYLVAYGRLTQAHAAMLREKDASDVPPAASFEGTLARAGTVVKALRGRGTPLRLRAGRLALRAWLLHLRDRHHAAQRMLHRALRAADGAGAPLLTFEITHLHARILRALGHEDEAQEQATFALGLAFRHGWAYRARWIRNEFGIDDPIDVRHSQTTGISSSGQGDARLRRRLKAVQQVSATAASVLDPDEVIRIALGIVQRLLSAERVFLFLVDQDADAHAMTLRPHRGCDAEGNDLRELTNYSSTLVERVQDTGEVLVVTGSEQGAALGSRSAVTHGLRSILVAPLHDKERLLGVVYLDSRVARGIFTADDAELLVTITHHVAAALATARTAQLEAEVQVANRQRDLAETLSTSMTTLSSTLDPDEVLDRLLHTVAAILPGDHAVLFQHDDDRLVLTAHTATVTPQAVSLDPADHPTLRAIAARDDPLPGASDGDSLPLPAELAHLLGTPASWLAVPIALRGEHAGIIVIGSAGTGRYTDVEIKIAAVLGDQGAVAHDNARLFSRVHEAATIDALTELATRRHFWELAERLIAIATRHHRPLAAIMLDVDHFKAVNDAHGHAVGDRILRDIAARIRGILRDTEVAGRYGGEEFAIIVPDTSDAAPVAERLRAVVARQPLAAGDDAIGVTISVGVAHLQRDDSLDSLLNRADAALYRAKAAGRNRVAVA